MRLVLFGVVRWWRRCRTRLTAGDDEQRKRQGSGAGNPVAATGFLPCESTSHPSCALYRAANLFEPARVASQARSGGRRWWAHFDFGRMNVGSIIGRNQIEDVMDILRFGPVFLWISNGP